MRIGRDTFDIEKIKEKQQTLTDDMIKEKISQTASNDTQKFIPIVMIGGFILSALSFVIGQEWIVYLAFLIIFTAIPTLVVLGLMSASRAKKAMTMSDMADTKLFLTEFVSARRVRKSKGADSYYIKFVNENGNVVEQRTTAFVYREFNGNCKNGDPIVLLRYPKYKKPGIGGYHFFDAYTFKNKSSFPTPPALEDFLQKKDLESGIQQKSWNNDYNDEW